MENKDYVIVGMGLVILYLLFRKKPDCKPIETSSAATPPTSVGQPVEPAPKPPVEQTQMPIQVDSTTKDLFTKPFEVQCFSTPCY
jgi:hypothetical protein